MYSIILVSVLVSYFLLLYCVSGFRLSLGFTSRIISYFYVFKVCTWESILQTIIIIIYNNYETIIIIVGIPIIIIGL